MATSPKVGARNDLFALKEARRHSSSASGIVDAAMRQLDHMREHVGRPDYGPMARMLGQMALDLAKVSRNLDEMWVLRAQAGLEVVDLAEQLTELRAQVEQLRAQQKPLPEQWYVWDEPLAEKER